jgi:transposase
MSGHKRCRSCRESGQGPASSIKVSIQPQRFTEFFRQVSTAGDVLTPVQRAALITLHSLGLNQVLIQQLTGCVPRTIQHWITQFEEQGNLEDQPRSGRPPVSNAKTDESIVQFAQSTPFTTPRIIKHELDLKFSARTVRRRLDEAGLRGRVARVEYPFEQKHIDARIQFAQKYQSWTEDQWCKVLFMDETHILLGQHGRVWVQRPEDTEWMQEYIAQRDPWPQKLSVWGCFSAQGVGAFDFFDGRTNSRKLKELFDKHLVRTANQLCPRGKWSILQDNASYHGAKIIQNWLQEHKVDCIEIPSYSPDLNPIENLWADLKRRIEAGNPRTIEQLKEILTSEWQSTSKQMCRNLAISMMDRCQSVLYYEGYKTPY